MGQRPMGGQLPGMPQARSMMPPSGMPGGMPPGMQGGLPPGLPGGDQGGLGRFFGGQGMMPPQQMPSMPNSMAMGLEDIERRLRGAS